MPRESVQSLAHAPVIPLPPPPSRFTPEQWKAHNRVRTRHIDDQSQLADRVVKESERVRILTQERADNNKKETDRRIEQKIALLEFCKSEIELCRKQLCDEVEALNVFKDRLMDSLKALREQGLTVSQKCYMMRENRLGIDMAHDEVEKELLKEMEVIRGVISMYERTLEQTKEQIRVIRSTMYLLDRDHEDKSAALMIDKTNLNMKETDLNLSTYHGTASLDAATLTQQEWDKYTTDCLLKGNKQLNTARSLRFYIDTLLRQGIEDLKGQYNAVNEAFRRRIEETRQQKDKLELEHFEISRQVNEMTLNITELEKSIAEKEGYIAVAHTRLGNRAQRRGIELVRDEVETKLCNEVMEVKELVGMLQQMMAESQASLRYLLKTQVQIEEDLNIKINTLKIDEVDCMTLRLGMDYHAY